MRLVAEHGDNRVVVLDDVESLMETGTWMVKVENVTRVLRAIRQAAAVLLPRTPNDPARMEYLAARIRGVALTAKTLAEAHPDEEAAQQILAVLQELNLQEPAASP